MKLILWSHEILLNGDEEVFEKNLNSLCVKDKMKHFTTVMALMGSVSRLVL